jgi:hypothetical protein
MSVFKTGACSTIHVKCIALFNIQTVHLIASRYSGYGTQNNIMLDHLSNQLTSLLFHVHGGHAFFPRKEDGVTEVLCAAGRCIALT